MSHPELHAKCARMERHYTALQRLRTKRLNAGQSAKIVTARIVTLCAELVPLRAELKRAEWNRK